MSTNIKQLVFTIKDRCRVCYTCVRECPAKAIKIVNGQAEVINERCIGCGTCTVVCSQGAKVYLQSTDQVHHFLKTQESVIAVLAPSFPAEFTDISLDKLVGMIRKLGFSQVIDVAFGADCVAMHYKVLFESNQNSYIAANCPAIVNYIKQYYPKLIQNLSPIITPAMAAARIARHKYGNKSKVVFIGPCVAKKSESDDVDASLTFQELRQMLKLRNISPENTAAQGFSNPQSGTGVIFALSRGMIQTAEIEDNALRSSIIVAEGRINYQEAIKEFESGQLCDHHLELLACEGCIMGPGMTANKRQYARHSAIEKYARQKLELFDVQQWNRDVSFYLKNIDYHREYSGNDQRFPIPTKSAINEVLQKMGKYNLSDHLNCGACGYDSCMEHAIAIIRGLAEIEMCLPFTIDQLHSSIKDLAVSNKKLASVQQALKQSEKLANMGQLSAGIAHELNNPLGVVIMYANILYDESDENSPVREDLKLIVEQAERCKKIVGGLLNFARRNQVKSYETDMLELCKNSLKSLIIPQNVKVSIDTDCDSHLVLVDKEQFTQVLNNLSKNAIEAMPTGGELRFDFSEIANTMIIKITDTGSGIPTEHLNQIFEPFFTTKEIGKGTGLGLATTYGIIKMHKGQIKVESNTNSKNAPTGTCFTISLPKN